MPSYVSLSILLLSTLVVAGCGAASGLGSGGSSGTTSDTTSAAGSGGSSGTTSNTTSFPVGTFTSCAEGNEGPDGSFVNEDGVISGATLTVAQEGSTLTVTYVDLSGANDAFTFEPTSDTSAVLASGGATATGFTGNCVQGPGDIGIFPATVTAAAGALTYEASTMFLALVGTIAGGDGTPCGATSAPERVWVICGAGDSGPLSNTGAPSPVPQFPAGTYTCTSAIATNYQTGGSNEYVAGGGTGGTLTVTQSGAQVTAAYTGDTAVSGTLDFAVTTSASANADPGQTLLAPCLVPLDPPPLPGPPETLAVAAGSLAMVDDTTLFLSLSGSMTATQAMSSSCPGALKMGSILCTKQ
jgi:hypothetical protein